MRRWFGILIVPRSQSGVQRHVLARNSCGHAITCNRRPLRSPQRIISGLGLTAGEADARFSAATLCRSVLPALNLDRACGPADRRLQPWRQIEPPCIA